MNLMDIIALAKAGYSVSDVKELLSLTSSEDKEPAPQETEDEKTEVPEEVKEPTHKQEPEKSTEDPAKVVAIDTYKQQIAELEKQVKDLQQKNVHTDVSQKEPGKTDEDIINDITRSFM